MNKCYSYDEEDFHCYMETPLEQAVEFFLDENEGFEGETEINLFEGEKIPRFIGDFVGDITEQIGDFAYAEHDHYSESWAKKIYERQKEIKEIIRAALNNWADENDMQPNFYDVGKVFAISVKIKVDKDGNWEEVKA